MATLRCYRFVEDDLTSTSGDVTWEVGQWNAVSGDIVCCRNGLHASATPRDSLRHVYGGCWFIAEARGEIAHQGTKFAASEMRLVQEIPVTLLRRFALWCAQDRLPHYEAKYPADTSLRECLLAVGDHLDGGITTAELGKRKAAVTVAGVKGGDAARALAAGLAAAYAADGRPAWAAAAAAAAHASHTAAKAIAAAEALSAALAAADNVESGALAADTAQYAATTARAAAATAATAHAAAVTAAHDVPAPDTASDAYYSGFSAFATHCPDEYYAAQDQKLRELIDGFFAKNP